MINSKLAVKIRKRLVMDRDINVNRMASLLLLSCGIGVVLAGSDD